MRTEKYEAGERLRVTAEGIYEPKALAREVAHRKLRIRLDAEHCVLIPLDTPGVTVEVLAPPEPEWWDRRGPGMVVLSPTSGVWMHADSSAPQWVSGHSVWRTDAELLDGDSLTLLHDPSVPTDPLHTWPPDRPGLWYRDRRDVAWVSSVLSGGHTAVRVPQADKVDAQGGRADFQHVENTWGPMTPIATPGGAS